MLIKEATTMRRVLYLIIVLVLLATTASTVLAEEPRQIVDQDVYLGELVLVLGDGFEAFERVDAYLYRPSAIDSVTGAKIWPLTLIAPPVGPTGSAPWWAYIGDSEQRRWSFAETEGTIFETADVFGIWGAILMVPRDEVWYPCSFPLKWKCNFQVAPGVWELHSPQQVNFIGFPLIMEYWPWIEIFGAPADPMDTVSPLEVYVLNYDPYDTHGWIYETVVTGYDWKWSDIP